MANTKFTPVGYNPRGWQIRPLFVDDEGNVFERGQHQPDKKGTLPPSRKADEPQAGKQVSEQQSQQPSQSDPISDPFKEPEIPPELIKKLEEKFDEKYRKREEAQLIKFEELLKKNSPQAQGLTTDQGVLIDSMAQALAKKEMYSRGGVFYHDIKELDPEDYNEVAVIFTSYGNDYLIVDDVRRGHAVRTPYGRPFKFRFQGGRVTTVGRVQTYSCFCSFSTNSKKEIKWLREHSLYNIAFYEDNKLALSADARKIGIASRVSRQIADLEMGSILARAKQYGIAVGGNLADIRTELTLRMAEEEMKKYEEVENARNQEAVAERFNQ